MNKKLKSYFITGLLVVVPLYITIYIFTLIVGFMDGAYHLLPEALQPDKYLPFQIPGLGVIITLAGILIAGVITQNFMGRWLLHLAEKILMKVPVVKIVYNASKQFMETFFTTEHEGLRKVVLVEFPSKGLWSLGFLTGKVCEELQKKTPEEMLNVFLPTTPNPTSGYYVLIPKREVIMLDMSIEDAFKVIMTGGMISPEMNVASPIDKGR